MGGGDPWSTMPPVQAMIGHGGGGCGGGGYPTGPGGGFDALPPREAIAGLGLEVRCLAMQAAPMFLTQC